jgi:hypothetical protein
MTQKVEKFRLRDRAVATLADGRVWDREKAGVVLRR